MIRHMVVFRLYSMEGPIEETAFFAAAQDLSGIPGVHSFRIHREVSTKNQFDYGLTMEFADQGAYDAYNSHPRHAAFVAEVWVRDVAEFLEIDLVPC